VSRSLTIEQRAIGAYLGLAVGDALGATTEFLTPHEIRDRYGLHDSITGGGWLHLKPGQVTDDTGMSLALGDAILAQGGVRAVPVARAFSDWMRSKPVDIGHTVRRGIVHFRDTGVPAMPENEFDAGNGACMRCLPVAIAYWNAPRDRLLEASRIQSHITHNNPQADAGTEAVLCMLVAAFRGEPLAALEQIARQLVTQQPAFRYERRPVQNPGGWIVETLQAVFQALFGHKTLEAVLVDVVNRGGDADTTGAIAGMLAGACQGVDAIPRRWLRALDGEVRRACEQQALALLEMASNAEWSGAESLASAP